ncbi:BTB/POZ domain-containing protein [Xylariaceae sp. FL0016]|nr:BTB/POZ domain-containing protein [Xylariaceae sp. FL0016]
MTHLLWKSYWENDVDRFRRLLASATYSQTPSKISSHGVGNSPAFGSSPRAVAKSRKASGICASFPGLKNTGNSLGKAEVNSRDHCGLTILLRAASSTSSNAVRFVEALLEHPALDIYVQDLESGWNALHRSLYAGNISIARLLLEKERRDLTESLGGIPSAKVGQLIKTKDHEGNSPFDLYNATIALRTLKIAEHNGDSDEASDLDESEGNDEMRQRARAGLGEEVFTFGSNKNLSLGLGDEDDRQFPERVHLKRPAQLVRHFYEQYLLDQKREAPVEDTTTLDLEDIPTLIQNRPLLIEDVVLAKLHSAILTTDPFSNLYVAGVGRNGRLGLGDENTQFHFLPVQGSLSDKKVIQVALGQNHSMAVTSDGELWTWGSNTCSQLGFTLPTPVKPDEEPMSCIPRQVFGPLKKETVLGVAASSIHSVCHTGSSLFCWGKNVGQLALMDADSRSLEVQTIPRKVAANIISNHGTIIAVSAIDKATTCLFEDHTVCVLTSYGYNMIKFPLSHGFAGSPLQRTGQLSLFSLYDLKRREIHQITSGGDTIVAVSGTGDLFTMQLKQKLDGNELTASTTNPAKIKGATTTPQCIWHSGKDGVRSASVGENGSVIIATESGAVWRRVKRTKAKDTKTTGSSDTKRKAFKFQRVPYVTDVAAVRGSPFGTYAVVRKDCDVTRDQLEVNNPSLWEDIAPLMPLRHFKAHNTGIRENKDTWKFQDPDILRGRVDDLGRQVLISTDLEEDLSTHLRNLSFSGVRLGTSVRLASHPELAIPVHSWILSARSPMLRASLQRYRDTGCCEIPELLSIRGDGNGVVVEFTGSVDLIALLNLVVYMYTDKVIPAWSFTRQSPPLAYRYRQIRTDLMKLAARLNMGKLEAAVRMQSTPPRSMNEDFRNALEDTAFFEDGDAVLDLDGDSIPVHSAIICQRCPWFQGLFQGRSGGAWLDSRRAAQEDADQVHIDLQHMDPEAFHYVLQHLYSDTADDLFDDVIADSIDDFSELVMDVMSIANELMMDRLSQICQKIIGRFVSTRNVSNLLNAISQCSVTEFKDKGLEYVCLEMEGMLENHLLDGLEEDLMFELDAVVRDNQLARCPFARSGRAELLLQEQNPELAQDVEEERQIRIKEMAFRAAPKDDDRKLSSSFKTRFGSADDLSGISLTPEKGRRKSQAFRNEPFSPDLRPKDSHTDLIFDMDEEGSAAASPVSPSPQPMIGHDQSDMELLLPLAEPRQELKGKMTDKEGVVFVGSPTTASHRAPISSKSPSDSIGRRVSQGGNPWGASTLPTSRLDLKEILADSRPVQSALSAGLAAEMKTAQAKAATPRLSQKERKKQLQQQAEQTARDDSQSRRQQQVPWTKVGEKKDSPWQKPGSTFKPFVKDMLEPTAVSSDGPPHAKPLVAVEASSSRSIPRRTASPDTRFSGQRPSATPAQGSSTPQSSRSAGLQARSPQPLTPHSRSYIKRAPQPEQEVGIALADIIGQQQREQQMHKEAVAKRSLQEIQEEQAFQEWWDQESRRTQEEEARRTARDEGKGNKEKKKGRGRGKPRGPRDVVGTKGIPADVGAGGSVGNGGRQGGVPATSTGGSTSARGKGRGNRGRDTEREKVSRGANKA